MTFAAHKAVIHSARSLYSRVFDLGNVIAVFFQSSDKDNIFKKTNFVGKFLRGSVALFAGFYLPAPSNYCTLCAKQ